VADRLSQLILLLPERRRFSGQPIAPGIGKMLARADRGPDALPGERAQLQRYFEILPRGWPMAAITRDADAGDAAANAWLRADPVCLRPDMSGARLIAWGNLGMTAAESETFLRALRPLFGDAGFLISATAPERWYVMLPREAKLPPFTDPRDALGESLLAHLPEGLEARRWRVLLNDAQITLHNHPRNAERQAAGLMPVNSLWFWGGGLLPDSVSCSADCVISDDEELLALARRAGVSRVRQDTGDTLLDLRRARDWPELERSQLEPALASLRRRHGSLRLDFADGANFRIEPRQRWRLWRKPLAELEA